MKFLQEGGHGLFQINPATARDGADLLAGRRRDDRDAVRQLQAQLEDGAPPACRLRGFPDPGRDGRQAGADLRSLWNGGRIAL